MKIQHKNICGTSVLSNQNDTKFESEELATDLMSALKEFEETTAKITSAHQKQETKCEAASTVEMQQTQSTEEKGPIEFFNRTKETLRHVTQNDTAHRTQSETKLATTTQSNETIECFNRTKQTLRHVTQNELANRTMPEPKPEPSSKQSSYEPDESNESYVKIPVQQLINTFEQQMRSIIKQKINENIQLNLDGGTEISKQMAANNINGDRAYSFAGKENEMSASESMSMHTQQQQMSNQFERHVSQSQSEQQYQWTQQMSCTEQHQTNEEIKQSTVVESTPYRFNSSNDTTQLDAHFDGGKAQTTF